MIPWFNVFHELNFQTCFVTKTAVKLQITKNCKQTPDSKPKAVRKGQSTCFFFGPFVIKTFFFARPTVLLRSSVLWLVMQFFFVCACEHLDTGHSRCGGGYLIVTVNCAAAPIHIHANRRHRALELS